LKVHDENSRIRIQNPDPDSLVRGMDPHPPQNVMDPQHCLQVVGQAGDGGLEGTAGHGAQVEAEIAGRFMGGHSVQGAHVRTA